MYIILFILIFYLVLLLTQKKFKFKQIESFRDKNIYDTEIHFLTFWNKNNETHKKKVEQKIKELNNTKIRIIKELKINKNNIKSLFKNVRSEGKHYNHDIDIFILEVPNIYKIHSTHDNKKGEKVNDIMYQLKKTARGDYKNYKLAHGSFNKNEANDFFKEYFDLLGEFKNYEEVKLELNNSNLFWLYDRVTYNLFGKEADIDLVVDSIPAICFCLRKTDINYKINITVNHKKIILDLRDFDSNYYPKEWLQNIKNKQLYLKKNNVQIPNLENHFMLGLYHMYIHKKGKQNEKRIEELNNMSKKIGYKNLDLNILFGFINNNNYKIKKPTDNGVGFFIKELTRGGKNKKVYEYKKNIYYLYENKNIYEKDKYILTKLEKYNFTPKILYNNDNSLVLNITNVGDTLNKIDISKLNDLNFKDQINYIENILKKNNIVHNDLNYHNITLKGNKLYLIDFEYSILNNDKDERGHSPKAIYCKNFPKFNNEINFVDYLKKNKCFNYK